MRIRYTVRAVADLERLRDFIARHDSVVARRISQQLLESLETLADQPESGRPVTALAVRQWVTGDYVVRYQIQDGEVIVLRLWHGREDR